MRGDTSHSAPRPKGHGSPIHTPKSPKTGTPTAAQLQERPTAWTRHSSTWKFPPPPTCLRAQVSPSCHQVVT